MEQLAILIVDDEKAARYGMRKVLAQLGPELIEAADGREALETIQRERPDLVFMDINMPGMNGMAALEKIVALDNPPLVVMVTAYGSEKIAVEAMKRGAYDYLAKPYELDELRMVAAHALEKIVLQRENERLRSELLARDRYGEMIGTCEPMQRVFELIEKVAQSDVPVLITGESGTGKEMVAREIHRRGSRERKPFVSVNCAAIPENLIESELFGHEKGAFTGAVTRREGKFEVADRGTLFLDEIGDMAPGTQAKVLRILEEQRFERLGGTETICVDVRLISATNQDLEQKIKNGTFREELYYRLKVVDINLPPLRLRSEDMVPLVQAFVQEFGAKHRRPMTDIAPETLKVLIEYPWPGNVRQLRNVIEKCVVLTDSPVLMPEHLPAEVKGPHIGPAKPWTYEPGASFAEAKKQMVQEFETELITSKLAENRGNVSRTAAALKLLRQSLQQKLRELGINADEFRR